MPRNAREHQMHDETSDHDHDPVQDQPVPDARTAGSFDMPTDGEPVPAEDDAAGHGEHDDHRRVTPLRSGVAMMLVGRDGAVGGHGRDHVRLGRRQRCVP